MQSESYYSISANPRSIEPPPSVSAPGGRLGLFNEAYLTARSGTVYIPGEGLVYVTKSERARAVKWIARQEPELVNPRESEPWAEVTVYADMVQVKKHFTGKRDAVQRGRVDASFSSASRKRFIENIAKVRDVSRAAFITLTYPGAYSPDPEVWKRDLFTFLKRVKRLHPEVRGFWRLEAQKRGAPHYHLIVFGLASSVRALRPWVSQAWYEVVGSGDPRHKKAGTRSDVVRDRAHVMRYVSKYAAKCDEAEQSTGELRCFKDSSSGDILTFVGRLWGRFGDLDQAPTLQAKITFGQAACLQGEIVGIMSERGHKYAARLESMPPFAGWTAFGFGDSSTWGGQDVSDTIAELLRGVHVFDELSPVVRLTWSERRKLPAVTV